nr:hypothetical protein [Tanacetum cinerariifolium]
MDFTYDLRFRAAVEDSNLAREIDGLYAGLTACIEENEYFIDELDVLADRTMSSPNHLTSNIEDAFSEYISVVPNYSPASPGKTYSSASNNLTDVIPPTSSNFSLFHDDPYISIMNAYATFTPSPISIPPPIIKPPSESPEFFLSKELLSPR